MSVWGALPCDRMSLRRPTALLLRLMTAASEHATA
ncbi:hypothetical protein ABIF66_011740 [Bradyrhizobium japonicum]